MSLKHKRDWLEACVRLLRYYQGELDEEGMKKVERQCPLCPVATLDVTSNKFAPLDYWCRRACIWYYFEGKRCVEWAHENWFDEDPEQLRNAMDDKWEAARIPMLKEWIQLLELELQNEEV